jgi:hypothetical protein
VSSNGGDFTIPQSDWVIALGKMDYADRELIEVEMPSGTGKEAMQAAGTFLREAEDHFLGCHYGDAVAACRQAVEKLQSVVGTPPKVSNKGAKGYTKNERILVVLEMVRRICLLSHHPDPVCDATTFERHDAQEIIAMVASIMYIYTR